MKAAYAFFFHQGKSFIKLDMRGESWRKNLVALQAGRLWT